MQDIRFENTLYVKLSSTGFVSVMRNKGYSFEFKQGKAVYSFIFAENGELNYRFKGNKETLNIKTGDVLFIPKNLPYKTVYLKDDTVIKIITFDIVSTSVPAFLATPVCKSGSEFSHVFTSIQSKDIRNSLYLSAKTYELLYLIENKTTSVPKKYKSIIPAVDSVKLDYSENRKLIYYANLCNMSESNFRKLFKEYTGKTFIEYRNLIRISEANKKIESGEFTVAEAAYLSGFNNMSFFYEIYNRYKSI